MPFSVRGTHRSDQDVHGMGLPWLVLGKSPASYIEAFARDAARVRTTVDGGDRVLSTAADIDSSAP